ncbi:adenylosuccinate lyase [Gleimia hominis]|uniref:Adenylosuccinate lyase n=1 Tax=Gleimia hominis TaxID=595468 RepID=A0ABU3I8D4_9ACTO|nr:adenylosuccinate lyase [Gleimia hominis]MDT3766647.1 adenylosuccinate lyase [Gleimia hominis]
MSIDLSTIQPSIALGPLDGRYRRVAAPLVNHLSEPALNRARVHVEVEWLIFLLDHQLLPGAPQLTDAQRDYLRSIAEDFDADAIAWIAQAEAQTRHDVKAVEYYVKHRLDNAPADLDGVELDGEKLKALHEVVHIFCTSEDVNNLAYALGIKGAVEQIWLPAARKLEDQLQVMIQAHSATPMLARTHGQPATPTTVGKELAVFAHRLSRQRRCVEATEYLGKMNGATGTYAAHVVALPNVDWLAVTKEFVGSLGLEWNPLTTQIESYDWQADLYAHVAHYNRVAHNLATDAWTYISMDYFHQNLQAQGSTGSSTMPHKVNPIRFENAEANLEVSCALLDNLAQTLTTSRMQRDLTDSSTKRTIGVALGHSLLALNNLRRGLEGVDVNASKMRADLENNWEVLGEAVQQTMRVLAIAGVKGMEDPYERLKELTRGHKIDGSSMRCFIKELGLPAEEEKRLLALTPANYVGVAPMLTQYIGK